MTRTKRTRRRFADPSAESTEVTTTNPYPASKGPTTGTPFTETEISVIREWLFDWKNAQEYKANSLGACNKMADLLIERNASPKDVIRHGKSIEQELSAIFRKYNVAVNRITYYRRKFKCNPAEITAALNKVCPDFHDWNEISAGFKFWHCVESSPFPKEKAKKMNEEEMEVMKLNKEEMEVMKVYKEDVNEENVRVKVKKEKEVNEEDVKAKKNNINDIKAERVDTKFSIKQKNKQSNKRRRDEEETKNYKITDPQANKAHGLTLAKIRDIRNDFLHQHAMLDMDQLRVMEQFKVQTAKYELDLELLAIKKSEIELALICLDKDQLKLNL